MKANGKWDRTDAIIAALALGFIVWGFAWVYVACHFIWKFW